MSSIKAPGLLLCLSGQVSCPRCPQWWVQPPVPGVPPLMDMGMTKVHILACHHTALFKPPATKSSVSSVYFKISQCCCCFLLNSLEKKAKHKEELVTHGLCLPSLSVMRDLTGDMATHTLNE